MFEYNFLVILLLSDSFDESGQFDIILRQATAIVSGKSDIDLIIDIEPLWMMVHLLSFQPDASHESESLIEIFEIEFLLNGVPSFDKFPSGGF